MQPIAGVSLADRAAYLHDADALVVADLHLGWLERSAVSFPVGDGTDLESRLEALLDRFEPKTVVVAGDVLHAFDGVPRSARRDLETLGAVVGDRGAEFRLVAGNHDGLLDSLVDDIPDSLVLGDTVVAHGHETPEADGVKYVIGHDHPAINIDGAKHPCYLHGEGVYRDADVLVLPAFTRFARGTVVNGRVKREFSSPLLADVDGFVPLVRDESTDETLAFPPLGQLRDLF